MSSSESPRPRLGTRVGTYLVGFVVMAVVIGALLWLFATPDGKRLMDSLIHGLSDLMAGQLGR